jgi:3-hydroxyacyl-CoA dehydrogenase
MAPSGSASGPVRYAVADGVATLTLCQPPLNTLGHALRSAIEAAFLRATADPAVKAIVLAAEGRSWPVGADIREFGRPPQPPGLPDLLARIEASDKPVIASLHGTALGGGLELALVASYRVSTSSLRTGLPEITLGLLPGAGGTQRLPRLVGADAALDMMLTGAPIGAEHALAIGLVDLVVGESPDEAAQRRALDHAAGRRPLPTTRERTLRTAQDAGRYLAAVEEVRAQPRAAHERAAVQIIDCVEAAILLPPDLGLAKERAAFLDLVASPQARALRHVFLSERRLARVLDPPAEPVELGRIAVVGGGGIGAGLATALIRKGVRVTLFETDATTLAAALTRIARAEEASVALGERTEAEREAAWARLSAGHGDPSAGLAGADLVIDCTGEDQDRRIAVLARIGGALADGVPILSVTNALDPQLLADASGDATLHASLYLREPVRRLALAEIALPAEAGERVVGAALALAQLLGWRYLRPGPRPGFLGPRLLSAYLDAADRCLAGGADPAEIDRAMLAFGMANGPFGLEDVIGLRGAELAHPVRRPDVAEDPTAAALRDWLATIGRTGRRASRGWHTSRGDGSSEADPIVHDQAAVMRPHVAAAATAIQRRIMGALANEGAWLLSEGRAHAPYEIDLAMLARGYPRWRGGPMQSADEAGLLLLRDDLRAWAEATGDAFWQPAPLWDDLIREGRTFGDLN